MLIVTKGNYDRVNCMCHHSHPVVVQDDWVITINLHVDVYFQ